jgi:hypothetical protein
MWHSTGISFRINPVYYAHTELGENNRAPRSKSADDTHVYGHFPPPTMGDLTTRVSVSTDDILS